MADIGTRSSALKPPQDHGPTRQTDPSQYHSLQLRVNGHSGIVNPLRTPQYLADENRFDTEFLRQHQESNERNVSPPCNTRKLSLTPSPQSYQRGGTLYQVSPEKTVPGSPIVIRSRPNSLTNKFRDTLHSPELKKNDLSIRELESLPSNVFSGTSHEE